MLECEAEERHPTFELNFSSFVEFCIWRADVRLQFVPNSLSTSRKTYFASIINTSLFTISGENSSRCHD